MVGGCGVEEWRSGEEGKRYQVGGAISSLGVKEEAREELSSNAEIVVQETSGMGN